jgi:hypothetical protein
MILIVRNTLVLVALEQRSLTTALFPAATAAAWVVVIVVLVWRRRILAPSGSGVVRRVARRLSYCGHPARPTNSPL